MKAIVTTLALVLATASAWSIENPAAVGDRDETLISPSVVPNQTTPPKVRYVDQVVKFVVPQYPRELRQRGEKGFVKLDVMVDEGGGVIGATVMESTNKFFTEEALRVINEWEFIPDVAAKEDGHRHVYVPIRFVLAAD